MIPTAHSNPGGITLGTDGNIWFSENAGNKIGRLTDTPGHSSYVVVHDSGYYPLSQGIALSTGTTHKPTTVRWLFEGPNAHSVTDAYGGSFFDSGSQEPGAQFTHTFTTAGTFNYADSVGSLTGGSIKVTPQAALGSRRQRRQDRRHRGDLARGRDHRCSGGDSGWELVHGRRIVDCDDHVRVHAHGWARPVQVPGPHQQRR